MGTYAKQVDFLLLPQINPDTGSVYSSGYVKVLLAGTSTKATVYSARDKGGTFTNPFALDADGTKEAFLDAIVDIELYEGDPDDIDNPGVKKETLSGLDYRGFFGLSVATKAALKGVDGLTGETVYMEGRAAAGDGGGGMFYWSSSDLSSEVAADAQEAIYVAPTGEDGSTGAWVRDYSGAVNLLWFGTDDTAIQAWSAYTDLYAPGGTYEFTTTIALDEQHLRGDKNTTFQYSGSGVAMTLDDGCYVDSIFVNKPYSLALETSAVGVRVLGAENEAKGLRIEGFHKGLNLYAVNKGVAHNNISLERVYNNKFGIYYEVEAGGSGWVNENIVIGGRLSTDSAKQEADTYGIYIKHTAGLNVPNNNKFYGTSIEGQQHGVFCRGLYNFFYGLRTELPTSGAATKVYDFAFQSITGLSSAYNGIFGTYGLPVIKYYDESGSEIDYNPGNIIFSRNVPIVWNASKVQTHAEGYRENYIEYSLADAELQFTDAGTVVFGISDGGIDHKNQQALNFVLDVVTTATRPATPSSGQMIYDADVGLPLWWTGANWIDAAGTIR